jgi:hypothetical protein
MLKKGFFYLASALALAAQVSNPPVTISAKAGASPALTVSVQLRGRTFLTGFSCAFASDGIMEAGDVVSCTLTANQKTRNGLLVSMSYPDGITGPGVVTIPNAETTAVFSIIAIDSSPVLMPLAFTVWEPGSQSMAFAEVNVPCCSRADLCGFTAAEIGWGPCGGAR